jgi:hypothetical protein
MWKRVHRTRQNALQLATQYHAVQMQQRAVLSWRIKLRQHHKLAKQARIAERYLVTRAAWGKWRQLVAEKSRQRKMQVFERDKARKAFESKSSLVIFPRSGAHTAAGWFDRAQKKRRLSVAEEAVKAAVAMVCSPLPISRHNAHD